MTKCTLYPHLAEVDQQAQDMFFRLVDEMAKREGITEQLKAADQMEWVRRMNNIQNRATEIVVFGANSFNHLGMRSIAFRP